MHPLAQQRNVRFASYGVACWCSFQNFLSYIKSFWHLSIRINYVHYEENLYVISEEL